MNKPTSTSATQQPPTPPGMAELPMMYDEIDAHRWMLKAVGMGLLGLVAGLTIDIVFARGLVQPICGTSRLSTLCELGFALLQLLVNITLLYLVLRLMPQLGGHLINTLIGIVFALTFFGCQSQLYLGWSDWYSIKASEGNFW
jgi:hypothetical protein